MHDLLGIICLGSWSVQAVLDFQSVSVEEAFRDICVLINCVLYFCSLTTWTQKNTGIACRRFFIDEFIPCFVWLTYCFATKSLC